MKQNNVLPLGVIAIGVVAAVVTGYQSRNLGTSSSVAKSQIPADAVTVTGSAQGMVGPVSVEIIADANKIYSINVTEANETENIGTMAIDQLPASIFESNSLAVDAVTGATITSNAIIQASVQALESAGLDPAAFGYTAAETADVPAIDTSDIPADAVTATGEAQGLGGPVQVEVTATADKIYNIVATGEKETPNIGTMALEQIPGAIVSANSLKVDAVSGATITSDAIIEAAKQALESAGFDPAAFGGADSSDSKDETESTATETETTASETETTVDEEEAESDSETVSDAEASSSSEASANGAAAEDIVTANHNAAAGVTGAEAYLNRYYTAVQ